MNFTSFDLDNTELLLQKMTTFADLLLNRRILEAKGKRYRIAEIEFYLSSAKGKNKDGITHCQPQQLTNDSWYVHRYFSSNKIKSKRRIGMDLTCGDKPTDLYGGILIRAIQDIDKLTDDTFYIYGPAKVFRTLIGEELISSSELALLEGQQVEYNEIVALREHNWDSEKVYSCPRDLGKSAPVQDKQKPYRFFIWGKKKHSRKEIDIFPYFIENKIDINFKNEFGRNF